MKCQKCQAENINEAVKCGICGAKLKHTKTTDDYTGSQQIISSVRRDRPNNQLVSTSSTHENRQTNASLSEQSKARVLLDSWQEKARESLGVSKGGPKSKKWIWIAVFAFLFLSPLVSIITNVIIPEIRYQIREHIRINSEAESVEAQDAVAVEAAADESALIDNEFKERYYNMDDFKHSISNYVVENNKLPESLKDIEKFENMKYADHVYDQVEINHQGVLIGKFKGAPTSKIYFIPESTDHGIENWDCYRVNISDESLNECALLESDPFSK